MRKYQCRLLVINAKSETLVSAQKSLIGQALVVTLKERFSGYHWSQCIYYITITVCFYERGVEKKCSSLSNIRQTSAIQQGIHTCMHCKIDADNQLHNCVCGVVSMRLLRIYLRNHCGECLKEIVLILHHDVKMKYEKKV